MSFTLGTPTAARNNLFVFALALRAEFVLRAVGVLRGDAELTRRCGVAGELFKLLLFCDYAIKWLEVIARGVSLVRTKWSRVLNCAGGVDIRLGNTKKSCDASETFLISFSKSINCFLNPLFNFVKTFSSSSINLLANCSVILEKEIGK
jgi:hypothetical protein